MPAVSTLYALLSLTLATSDVPSGALPQLHELPTWFFSINRTAAVVAGYGALAELTFKRN